MAMTDPVGDLLTRIRNGQSARLDSVTVPASRMRSNVLDVLQREGYIRGWFEEELRKGVKELRVELKYDNGKPVIKEIKRVSHPGPPRLLQDPRAAAPLQRPRHLDPVHAARRHVGHRGARRQCRRRSPLQGVLTMSRVGKNPVVIPAGVTVDLKGQALKVKGKRGELAIVVHDDVEVSATATTSPSSRAARAAARACSGAPPATSSSNMVDGRLGRLHHQPRDQRRRLPRRGGCQEPEAAARLQPRRRGPDPGRHPDQGGQADRDRDHRRRSPDESDSSPRRSAACVRPSPTRARASSTRPRRSGARKARRSKAITSWPTPKLFSPAASAARATRCARPPASVRASACSARASTSTPRSSTTGRA